MKLRLYTDDDYPTVCGWWKARAWPIIPKSGLPKTGIIVEGVCACFLYSTDSDYVALGFPISNPECSNEVRSEALDTMFAQAKLVAKDMGGRLLFTRADNPNLIERYKKVNFTVIDTTVSGLLCKLE